MSVKMIVYGDAGCGKSMFIASMAELGPIALVDTEYAWDHYLIPDGNGEENGLKFRLRPKVVELLKLKEAHPIYCLQTQELAKINQFVEQAGGQEEIIGIGIDSGSIYWDMISDLAYVQVTKTGQVLEGGLAWAKPKEILHDFQNLLLRTGKHFVWTAHVQTEYAGRDMTKVGEKPWLEKKMPHWIDIIGRMRRDKFGPTQGDLGLPVMAIEKSRSAGSLENILTNPTFGSIIAKLDYVPGKPKEMLTREEIVYRNKVGMGLDRSKR